MPVFKSVRIGVWEDGEFIGVVLFGQGATPEFGKKYGLERTEICELTRVALRSHATPVSRINKIAMALLKKKCPKLQAVISFADEEQGHHGGIYQAGNWIYAGQSVTHSYRVLGKIEHPKTLHSRYGAGGQSVPWLRANVDPDACRIVCAVKHRYLYPLNKQIRKLLDRFRKHYPRRVQSVDSGTPGEPVGKGRCNSDLDALNNA